VRRGKKEKLEGQAMSVNQVKQRLPQILSALDRAPMAGLLCAAALLFGVTLAWTRSAALPNYSATGFSKDAVNRGYGSAENNLGNDKTDRLHEGGAIINQAGSFRRAGDRVTFVSADNKQRLIVLENHALEQVAQTNAESPAQLEWIVSGTISEFRGGIFLLVSQANLKSPIRPGGATP
jgi:hypothetical protein